jgi:hypothetical protein
MITITTKTSGFPETQAAIMDTIGALRVAGRAVRNQSVAWFQAKNAAEPNKLGGKRTNFWTNVGRSVTQPIADGSNKIHIDVTHIAFAQKYFGGEITPKKKKWLTIPATALAYGKPAISFKLAFILLRPDLAMLVRTDAMSKTRTFKSQRRTAGGGVETFTQKIKLPQGAVMYWLVKRVMQRATPGCFPPQTEMEQTALTAYEGYLSMLLARAGQQGGGPN